MNHGTLLVSVLCAALIATGCQTVSPAPVAVCQPLGLGKPALLALKAEGFDLPDAQQRQAFAMALVPCLGSPDAELRDGIAYEALASMLRGNQLTADTMRQLRVQLLASLQAADDAAGVRRPFAALVLSEVARADRMESVFTAAERAELVNGAITYMAGISDYRGFDANDGWRHAVAHTADVFLQLALNPALTTEQAKQIAAAIAPQVAPPGDHFYVYGEYKRLARPVIYLALRHDPGEAFWANWFEQLASPTPLASWGDAWRSQAGLAKLHNTGTFAATVYAYAQSSGEPAAAPLASGALAVLGALQ